MITLTELDRIKKEKKEREERLAREKEEEEARDHDRNRRVRFFGALKLDYQLQDFNFKPKIYFFSIIVTETAIETSVIVIEIDIAAVSANLSNHKNPPMTATSLVSAP